jgi:hypothetical protein
MNKKIVFAAVLVTAAGLITAGIAPAQAAGAPTLPSNQHFFALDCDNFDPQLWSVDSTNANATRVGTITPTQTECPFSAVQNPVDGKNYVVMGGGAEYLATVDTTTGLYTTIASFTGDIVTDSVSAWKIVITTTGDAFVAAGNTLYRLNLGTAVTTRVGTYDSLSPSNYESMGYNALDNTTYLFDNVGVAFTLNIETGIPTPDPAHNVTLSVDYTCPSTSGAKGLNIYDSVFDANGNLWIPNNGCDVEYLVDEFATGTVTYIGELNDTQHALYTNAPYYDFYTYASLITTDATPALPDTGASATVLGTTSAVGAGLLATGALALIMVRRRIVRK